MTASWPVELGPALHATLMRRCPPPRSGTELEPLCCALTHALEAGELTIQLTDEQQALVIASGWLEQANCPLRLEGQRIGWRRWVDAMDAVIDELIERAARLPADRRSDGIAEPAETLNPEQRQAVLALDQVSVLLISGGPGTGKTSTVVEVLLRAISRTPTLRVGLAAPTGKAARRLGEAVQPRLQQLSCFTLHRWLEAGRHGFGRHQRRPLDLDLIVIDEMSMVDLALMQALIAALPAHGRLILVGDPAQLPPIGIGAVWNALQEPEVRQRFGAGAVDLTTTYRNRGAIASLATALREGTPELFQQQLDGLTSRSNARHHSATLRRLPPLVKEWWMKRSRQLAKLANRVIDGDQTIDPIAAETLLNAVEQELVLCPRRRGPWSLDDVHRTLLGPTHSDPRTWPAGLPVICGANQTEHGLANGDLGVTVQTRAGMRLLFKGLNPDGSTALRLLHPTRLEHVEPAVAITIHRSQGSEADHVVVLWPPAQDGDRALPLDRRLLYTAITRARASLDLITTEPSSDAC